ncbi:hypothetical protein [Paenibacillus contaminans]|uniref:Uncharacterized protein n=1 Tax=Paenibacillus contaminans TaxID=450362 RepID=A0A329MSD8_9BACL|nr:hypothetical protein [Paenibacillus contaminans]RAV22198.1 hypothetical protein DQG23_04400 [Paenibacillus contaminans]
MKWTMPSFLISLITMIAVALNNKFLWNLDPQQIIASVTLAINFVGVTIIGDIAKLRRGENPNWNSTKLFTLLFACIMIGFSEYVGIELDDESIWWIAGTAAAFITGKGFKDIIQTKGDLKHEPTQNNIGGGPAV